MTFRRGHVDTMCVGQSQPDQRGPTFTPVRNAGKGRAGRSLTLSHTATCSRSVLTRHPICAPVTPRDVIHRGGEVVVPIEEYRQLRQAMQEQQVNEEFDAARASYQARRDAGTVRYVSHEEAGRRLGMPSR
jgi:hypothetical protein